MEFKLIPTDTPTAHIPRNVATCSEGISPTSMRASRGGQRRAPISRQGERGSRVQGEMNRVKCSFS